MTRRLFTLVSGISFLLCAAVILLWARSYWRGDFISKTVPGQETEISSQRGKILFYHQINAPIFPIDSQPPHAQWSYTLSLEPSALDSGDETWLNRIGIYIEWRTASPSSAMPFSEKPLYFDTITQIILPHWLLATFLALLPALWIVIYFRRRTRTERLIQGRCLGCGFDLRASADRCPECGRSISSNSGRTA